MEGCKFQGDTLVLMESRSVIRRASIKYLCLYLIDAAGLDQLRLLLSDSNTL